jgi:hypothetical protein
MIPMKLSVPISIKGHLKPTDAMLIASSPTNTATTMNERITENLVRDILDELGYYSSEETIIEEQKSQIAEVSRLLKTGGKRGAGGRGCPEFIITSPSVPDFIIIVECKASVKWHESADRLKAADFAVDGAIHYGRKWGIYFTQVTPTGCGRGCR